MSQVTLNGHRWMVIDNLLAGQIADWRAAAGGQSASTIYCRVIFVYLRCHDTKFDRSSSVTPLTDGSDRWSVYEVFAHGSFVLQANRRPAVNKGSLLNSDLCTHFHLSVARTVECALHIDNYSGHSQTTHDAVNRDCEERGRHIDVFETAVSLPILRDIGVSLLRIASQHLARFLEPSSGGSSWRTSAFGNSH
jgi:hypothetical protein